MVFKQFGWVSNSLVFRHILIRMCLKSRHSKVQISNKFEFQTYIFSGIYCHLFAENSSVDYVLFESAGLLKEGLIREWNQIPKEEIKCLRSYLLQYVINHPTLSSYVRERIVQVYKSFEKSGSPNSKCPNYAEIRTQ